MQRQQITPLGAFIRVVIERIVGPRHDLTGTSPDFIDDPLIQRAAIPPVGSHKIEDAIVRLSRRIGDSRIGCRTIRPNRVVLKGGTAEITVGHDQAVICIAIFVDIAQISRLVNASQSCTPVESVGAARAGRDGGTRSTHWIVTTVAGQPEVRIEVIEARLTTGPRTGGAQPVVKNIVAKIVVGARADFATHAWQATFLVGIQTVVYADRCIRTGLQQRPQRVTGITDAAAALRIGLGIVLALGDIAVLNGDIIRQFICGNGFVRRIDGSDVIDHDLITRNVDRIVDVRIRKVAGRREDTVFRLGEAAHAVARSDRHVANDVVRGSRLDDSAHDVDGAGGRLAGQRHVTANIQPRLGVPAVVMSVFLPVASHPKRSGDVKDDRAGLDAPIDIKIGI